MPTIKTINDFSAAVHTSISAAFPECKIEVVNVTKNNAVHLTGMTIKPQNKKVAPTLYMEPYFAALKSGQTLASVIDQIISSCTAALSCASSGIDVEDLTEFAHVKDKICYKLVGRNKNNEFLSAVPHRDYLDLAIVYYLQTAITDSGTATVTVTNDLAHIWGVDESELYDLARKNTPRMNRGIVLTLSDVLDGKATASTHQECGTDVYNSFDISRSKEKILPMYVVTNTAKTFGAAVILYDGLLKDVAEYLSCSGIYAIPSSVHEFICIPDTFGNAGDIKQMVQEINAAEVRPDEVLSDSIYHYDVTTHELTVIS